MATGGVALTGATTCLATNGFGGGGLGLRLLTLEALQNDALIEFGPRGDRWHFRLLAPVKP